MLKFGPYSYLNSGQKMISLYCVTYANSDQRARATGQKLADKLSVKHTSLTARTSDKLLVLGGYRCSNTRLDKPIMILLQVHLQKPCYDFYFL